MAKYRSISLELWTDSKVDDEFTPEDKYFWLYLLTNPHTKLCGCYEISKKQIERETGYNWDSVERLLGRMEHVHKVIKFDKSTKELLIINWAKYNWSKSGKLLKALKGELPGIKNERFRSFVEEKINSFSSGIGCQKSQNQKSDTVSIPYANGIDTTDSDTEILIPDHEKNTGSNNGIDTGSVSVPVSAAGAGAELDREAGFVIRTANEYGLKLSAADELKCKRLVERYGMEMITSAIDKAVINQAKHFGYVVKVVENWVLKGITTPEQLEELNDGLPY